MNPCALFWFTVLLTGSPARATCQTIIDPDALYAARESLSQATRAESIWAGRLAQDSRDFESAWKLARGRYWLGGHGPQSERKDRFEAGIAAARVAIELQPNRPEGYFWIAANMAGLAESSSPLQRLKFSGPVKDALTTVLRLDRAFQDGSADRALGRWYYKVPGLFGGSKKKSEEHLRQSLTYAPQSTASLFFLAETLLALGRKDEARAALQGVIDAPLDPDWAPEDREFKTMASETLRQLGGS